MGSLGIILWWELFGILMLSWNILNPGNFTEPKIFMEPIKATKADGQNLLFHPK